MNKTQSSFDVWPICQPALGWPRVTGSLCVCESIVTQIELCIIILHLEICLTLMLLLETAGNCSFLLSVMLSINMFFTGSFISRLIILFIKVCKRNVFKAIYSCSSPPKCGYFSVLHTQVVSNIVQVEVPKRAGYISQALIALYKP